jgi:hypothetical protein
VWSGGGRRQELYRLVFNVHGCILGVAASMALCKRNLRYAVQEQMNMEKSYLIAQTAVRVFEHSCRWSTAQWRSADDFSVSRDVRNSEVSAVKAALARNPCRHVICAVDPGQSSQ